MCGDKAQINKQHYLMVTLIKAPRFTSAFHPQVYGDIVDKLYCVNLRCTMCFDRHMYYEMFTPIRLVNTSFTSHNYHFDAVVMVRSLLPQQL